MSASRRVPRADHEVYERTLGLFGSSTHRSRSRCGQPAACGRHAEDRAPGGGQDELVAVELVFDEEPPPAPLVPVDPLELDEPVELVDVSEEDDDDSDFPAPVSVDDLPSVEPLDPEPPRLSVR